MQVFTGTVLNQTGQAVEVVLITMAVYLTISLVTSIGMNFYNAPHGAGRTVRAGHEHHRRRQHRRAADIRFLQQAPIEPQPPPASIVGPVGMAARQSVLVAVQHRR